jgi:molecular chaperone Hsp33
MLNRIQILKNFKNFNFLKIVNKPNTTSNQQVKDYVSKKDHMISGFFKDGSARFVMSDISQTLKDVQKRFEIYDIKKLEELGIGYNTCLVMNSFLNGEERVKLLCQYVQEVNEGKSFLTTIYSESIGTGEVRGFIQESKVDSEALKNDFISLLKISKILYGHTSEVYGMVKLRNNNKFTEEDVFKYFEESEQIRTHVYCNFKSETKDGIVKDLISQSFILQKMPNCDLEELENRFEKIINNRNFKEICEQGLNISQFQQIFDDLKLEVELRRTPTQFFCRCSKDGLIDALVMMGSEEINDMKAKNQNSVCCKNCNKEYLLDDKDFEDILIKIRNESKKL